MNDLETTIEANAGKTTAIQQAGMRLNRRIVAPQWALWAYGLGSCIIGAGYMAPSGFRLAALLGGGAVTALGGLMVRPEAA